MNNEKFITMLKMLQKKTSTKELQWQEGFNEGSYQISFPLYTVQIELNRTTDDEIEVILSILDQFGKKIDQISHLDIKSTELGENPYAFMYGLFVEARRSAMGFEKALDTILESLK